MAAALEMQERACNGDEPRAVVVADRAFHDALVEGMDKEAALRGLQGHKRIFAALREGNTDTALG